ncbi:MAG: ATP-binding cassette domain-containing protein [Lachnospiraceae bacterium]|nr:ATP-binding cassette domain-containing protein [Lachnospiraceae bacterium]
MELTLNHLSKSYDGGKTFALNDFTKTLHSGVYGLLGANGAGKSTLMNLITQNLKSDSGTICWNGKEIDSMGKDYRALLGYMPQQQNLYDNFTGEEFLWYMASLKGLKKKQAGERIKSLIKTVNLEKAQFKRIHTYSGGMKQRLLIAQALLNDPSILIMDEPTAGLDPKERIRIRNFISEIASGKIVILATHVISDIEFIAKEILLIRQGELIQQGEPKELLENLSGMVWNVYMNESEWKQYEEAGIRIVNLTYAGEKICARILNPSKPEWGIAEEIQPTLEDVYLYYESNLQ